MSFIFDVHVAVHRDKFHIIEPTRCTNFSKFLFLSETQHVSDSSTVHYQEFIAVHTTMVYFIQVCCVYSGKLLMMNRGTIRNT